MKKLIAILAVFAVVAGAAFAQDEGSWSVGGSGRIGTHLDFQPMEYEGGHGTVHADGWDQHHNNVQGSLSVTYGKGGLQTGFGVDQSGGFNMKLAYYGENFTFNAEQNLKELVGGGSWERGSLWGNYTFDVLNGLKIEAAVMRNGQQNWATSTVFGDTFTHTTYDGETYFNRSTSRDWVFRAHNYLLVDLSPMEGLSLGFITPNLFAWGLDLEQSWNANGTVSSADLLTEALQYTVLGAKFATGPLAVAFQFALKGEIPEFDYTRVTGAANPNVGSVTGFNRGKKDSKPGDLYSGLYLGVTYQINDQMSAGADFRGIFGGQQPNVQKFIDEATFVLNDNLVDTSRIGIGASFNFNQGPFGVSAKIKFEDTDTGNKYALTFSGTDGVGSDIDDFNGLTHTESFMVGITPSFVLVEGYLKAELAAEFTFHDTFDAEATQKASDGKPVFTGVIDYMFQPALYFNFLGDGAGNWGTGFAVRYRWEGPATGGYFEPTKGHNSKNFLELVFNWSF